jgi:hypothetical protein
MFMNRIILYFSSLFLISLPTQANSVSACLDLFASQNLYRVSFKGKAEPYTLEYANKEVERAHRRKARFEIASRVHTFTTQELIGDLIKSGQMIYVGKHKFEPGTEFLASNEFDWSRTPVDKTSTDLLIGFGTNSSWDLAMRKQAKHLVIGDWSPWPIIGQAYLIAPLIRLAKTPQEFILMISGISRKRAQGISVAEAFSIVQDFDSRPAHQQRDYILEHLDSLVEDFQISDQELKFLTTYYAPRLGVPTAPRSFGPFQGIRGSSMAMLNSFFAARYASGSNGKVDSVFSSQENFNYLKNLFDQGRVQYGLTAIDDPSFYAAAKQTQNRNNLKTTTISVSNIFDCGCYNGLTFASFQNYLRMVLSAIGNQSPIVVFRTTNNQPPHGYYRYEVQNESQIPKRDEKDSSALKEAG